MFAVLSLALCLVAATRYLIIGDQVWHFTTDKNLSGRISIQRNLDVTVTRSAAFSWSTNQWRRWQYLGLTVPYWAIIVLSGILPAMWIVLKMREPKIEGNFCASCGYDLRATPQRCPECGIVPLNSR